MLFSQEERELADLYGAFKIYKMRGEQGVARFRQYMLETFGNVDATGVEQIISGFQVAYAEEAGGNNVTLLRPFIKPRRLD